MVSTTKTTVAIEIMTKDIQRHTRTHEQGLVRAQELSFDRVDGSMDRSTQRMAKADLDTDLGFLFEPCSTERWRHIDYQGYS